MTHFLGRLLGAQAPVLLSRVIEPTGAGEYVRRAAVARFLNANCPARARVLDLGGGEGHLYDALRPDLQSRYAVIDIEGGRHGLRVIGDITATPFPISTADCVCMSDVLEHIVDDVAALSEAVRITCKDGYVVLHVPSQRPKPFAFVRRAMESAEAVDHQLFPHVRDGYTLQGLTRLLANIDATELILVRPSFSALQSLIADFDGFLWWKRWTLLRAFPWSTIRFAPRAFMRNDDRSSSSGYLAVLRKTS